MSINKTDLDNHITGQGESEEVEQPRDARGYTDLERAVNRLQHALGYADLSYLATPDDIETIVSLTERMRPYIQRVFGPVDFDDEP